MINSNFEHIDGTVAQRRCRRICRIVISINNFCFTMNFKMQIDLFCKCSLKVGLNFFDRDIAIDIWADFAEIVVSWLLIILAMNFPLFTRWINPCCQWLMWIWMDCESKNKLMIGMKCSIIFRCIFICFANQHWVFKWCF